VEQLNLENEYGWNKRFPEAIYETRINQLKREIPDLERYVETLKAELYELEKDERTT